ncbi:hypothetical protein GCM10027299_34740 [Larkinella ripae]
MHRHCLIRKVVCLMTVLVTSGVICVAQDQFLGKSLGEVKSALTQKRIIYQEQLSPMGDATTLSYSATEADPKRVDLFFSHSLSFPQASKNRCVQLISTPMLQKAWVADTLKNRLLASGYQQTENGRFRDDRTRQVVALETIQDIQQPTIKMIRIVFTQQPQ